LDPLTTAEISVAVATVRAAGATPEVVSYTMIFFILCLSGSWMVLATIK